MVVETRIRYRCKENDNQIILDSIDGWLDELMVGDEDCGSGGWFIIGAKDLRAALAKVGYDLIRRTNKAVDTDLEEPSG